MCGFVSLHFVCCRHQIYNDCIFINDITITGDTMTYLKWNIVYT